MRWICQNCGYIFEREGFTEICPQCWQAAMKGESVYEQHEKKSDSECG